MDTVRVGNRLVGQGQPVFVVVETGTTCNGDLDTALRMVDAAKECGADAIKFQMIGADHFMSDRSVTYEYEWAGGHRSENMYDMFKGLEFPPAEWERIAEYCREREIIFYATIDYIDGIDLGERLGFPLYKMSSWDAANFPLARRMARTGKPIQVDLGPSTIIDIQKLIDVVNTEGNDQLLLLHCTHAATDDGINMRSVPYLKQIFHCPVGYSADSRDFVPDLVAVALGASIIEKRLTLDRNYPGHHHVKALEPGEFGDWVKMIRRAKQLLGEYAIRPSVEDLRQKELYFVSITANTDITAGTAITQEMLACKRPGTGIAPEYLELVVGRCAQRDIKRNELLTWDAI